MSIERPGHPVYHKPGGLKRNLVLTMSGAASSTSMHIEDQLTEVLAWILDHDNALAIEVAQEYLRGDDEALACLAQASTIGVSTQVHLPPLPDSGGTRLRPDLSLTTSGRDLQLLIEVKAGADFGTYNTIAGVALDQVSAYIAAWNASPHLSSEARIRRVGSLTPDGSAPNAPSLAEWRAADLSWTDLGSLVGRRERRPPVAQVAHDLSTALEFMFSRPNAPPGFLAPASALAWSVASHLAQIVSEPRLSQRRIFSPTPEHAYAGGYLGFTTPAGLREKLWVIVTARGSSYAEIGAPSGLWLCFTDQFLPNEASRRELTDQWRYTKDKAGYKMYRLGLPLSEEEIAQDAAGVKPEACAWAAEQLRISRLAS